MPTSPRDESLTPDQKALAINLDKLKYGTIVEIGAGQETARLFFSAGAAAGTIAKTMSAYDMSVSDDIYGKVGRYVSRDRLEQMLGREYDLVVNRLKDVRPQGTTFFAYAATVTAKSYKGNTECHGWIGIRVQLRPGAEPCDVILHVRMLDDDNRLQSEALGILGVNLIYGVFHYHERPKELIDSLSDALGSDRIEVDLIDMQGPEFRQVESRLMNLHLIRAWQTRAVMFDADGRSVVPAEMLYRKSAMVIRGSFKPPTRVHVDMTESGLKQFLRHHQVQRENVVVMAEITMSELVTEEHIADSDFLARVDLLSSLGYNVLISDYVRFFRLRSFLRRYTQDPIGIVLSVLDFDYLFNEQYYEGLEGGILEAMGKLFPDNTQVYVYPTRAQGELLSLENIRVPDHLRYLLRHLVSNRLMIASDEYDERHLHISARRIAEEIPQGRGEWEQQLPEIVTRQILERKLFGLP
ncbi:MAG TPA: hypothetical protein VK973_01785 [Arenicellales bacterium]|nr:hypothetical protein [Arenicellales bacterium]